MCRKSLICKNIYQTNKIYLIKKYVNSNRDTLHVYNKLHGFINPMFLHCRGIRATKFQFHVLFSNLTFFFCSHLLESTETVDVSSVSK